MLGGCGQTILEISSVSTGETTGCGSDFFFLSPKAVTGLANAKDKSTSSATTALARSTGLQNHLDIVTSLFSNHSYLVRSVWHEAQNTALFA